MDQPLMVAVRFATSIDLSLLFGVAAFGLYALHGEERRSGAVLHFGPMLATLAIAGAVLSMLWLVLLTASMAGIEPAEVDGGAVAATLSFGGVGTAWQVRIAALAVALGFALLAWSRPALALGGVGIAGGIALATLAWTGHGAMDEGARGWVHLGADIVHLLAAGGWIGALTALVLLVFTPAHRVSPARLALSQRALHGFAAAGSLLVALIVLSGIVNGWIIVGPANIADLPASLYGLLLLIKIVLFLAMLGLAAANRYKLTPALAAGIARGAHRSATARLRRSLAVETGCAVAILALVAWLGTLAPPGA